MKAFKILVTGANGFVGRHCIPRLIRDDTEVHAIIRSSPNFDATGIHRHAVDLFDSAATEKLVAELRPSHLLHLAWVTTPGTFRESPLNLDWVRATLGLVKSFSANGGRRVVALGSCAEYDLRSGFCDEVTTPLRPQDLYGVCKNATREILEYLGTTPELQVVWARLFFLYGPGEHENRLIAYVIRRLLAGLPAECTAGDQMRDYLFVEDAAAILVRLLFSCVRGPVNVATGQSQRIADMIRLIGRMTSKEELVRLGSRATPPEEVPEIKASTARLREAVGEFQYTSLKTGLRRSIDWWSQQ